MTVPKEINLQERKGFLEIYSHHEEISASELVHALGGKYVELHEEGLFTLPDDSLKPKADISVSPYIDLPVGARTLSGLVGSPYEKLNVLDYIYSQFGMHIEYKREARVVAVNVADIPVRISTEQTYFNYTDAAFLHMIYGLFACFSDRDRPLIKDIQSNGVLITTTERSTETALFVPGKLMQLFGLSALAWQRGYENTTLYPINIHGKIYETWDHQGVKNVRSEVELLLTKIHPVGVRVRSDAVADVYIRKH